MSSDRFEEYLLDLSDESFFSVMQNYLGRVESPYQKHDLIRRLVSFLSRPATLERLIALVGPDEAQILSACDSLPHRDADSLIRFFSGDIPPSAIRSIVSNLQDRLLLIRDATGELIINPIVYDAVAESVIPRSRLIPRTHIPPRESSDAPWLTLTLVSALGAFLIWNNDVFTRGRKLKRRFLTRLLEVFPGIFSEDDHARFLVAIRTMVLLQLVVENEDGTVEVPDGSWDELADIPETWVNPLVWAAGASDSLAQAFRHAQMVKHLLPRWPQHTGTSRSGFVRALMLTDPEEDSTVELFSSLVAAGVIQEYGDDYTVSAAAVSLLQESSTRVLPLLQANMEITLPGSAGTEALAGITTCSELVKFDQAPRFELTERSVGRAYREGRTVLSFLESLGPVPQNVRFHVQRWEERADAVKLRHGLVLRIREEEETLLLHNPAFSELGAEKLAPGLFILPPESESMLIAVFGKMGITAMGATSPTPKSGRAPSASSSSSSTAASTSPSASFPEFNRFFSRVSQPSLFSPVVDRILSRESTGATFPKAPGEPPAFLAELHQRVQQARFPENVRRELDLRIQRRLILFPEQLDSAPQVSDVHQAQGLDYLGKVRIIEQAIRNRDLLEIVIRSSSGAPERLLLFPQELDRSSNDLILRARTERDQKQVRIRVRKIALLRKLSGTLIRSV